MAAPCRSCGTAGGAKHPKSGLPRRVNGTCSTCNSRIMTLKRRMGLATFDEALAEDKGRTFTKRNIGQPAESIPVPTIFAAPHFHEVWEEGY